MKVLALEIIPIFCVLKDIEKYTLLIKFRYTYLSY